MKIDQFLFWTSQFECLSIQTAISALRFTKSANSVRESRFVVDLAAFVDFALRCFIAELSFVCLYNGELISFNILRSFKFKNQYKSIWGSSTCRRDSCEFTENVFQNKNKNRKIKNYSQQKAKKRYLLQTVRKHCLINKWLFTSVTFHMKCQANSWWVHSIPRLNRPNCGYSAIYTQNIRHHGNWALSFDGPIKFIIQIPLFSIDFTKSQQ